MDWQKCSGIKRSYLKQLITCLKIKSRCSTLMFVPFQQRKNQMMLMLTS